MNIYIILIVVFIFNISYYDNFIIYFQFLKNKKYFKYLLIKKITVFHSIINQEFLNNCINKI